MVTESPLSQELLNKYKELRKKYPDDDFAFLFDYIPGLENLDDDIDRELAAEKEESIDEQGEYWNITSFIFQKLKDESIFRKWCKEQFDCQFGVCAICHKPIANKRKYRAEHIVSRREYGTNYSNNLCLVHKNCKRKKAEQLEVNREDYLKNRFSERLDEVVSEITDDVRKDYPVKFPDELFTKN